MKIKYEYHLHPSFTTDNEDNPRLKVLEDFKIDRTLPKYLNAEQKVVLEDGRTLTVAEYLDSPDGLSMYRRNSKPVKRQAKGLIDSVKAWWANRKKNSLKVMLDVKELIKKNILTEEIVLDNLKVEELLFRLRSSGQHELALKIENMRPVFVQEQILLEHGYKRYISEEDMVKVFEKAEFNLRLDFLENYPNILPVDVAQKKTELDLAHAFDNYVVLHYDPDGKALKSIKEEEKRRDPILFGLIKGSNRFYFVADWVTKDDDITLDKILGILHRKNASAVTRMERFSRADNSDPRPTDMNGVIRNTTPTITYYNTATTNTIDSWYNEGSTNSTRL